jgi:hypothetical protein
MSVLDDSEPEPLPPPSGPFTSFSDHDESYRLSLERFNAFDSEISALRQSTSRSRSPLSPPTLPPISAVDSYGTLNRRLDDEDDEAHPRLPSNPFRNLELVEEDSNIPGLQVFSLGELQSSEDDADRREGQEWLLSV